MNFQDLGIKPKEESTVVTGLAQQLPFYAKYLLIAAYLASHNDVKLDRRLFMKHHGKEKKTQQSMKAKQMVRLLQLYSSIVSYIFLLWLCNLWLSIGNTFFRLCLILWFVVIELTAK